MNGFTHIYPIEVRFRDIDALGHVNNATLLTFVETARVPYLVAMGLSAPDTPVTDLPWVVAHINCDFRQPIFFGQQVTVGTRTTRVGRTSLRLEHRVEADGQLAAEGYCVLVHYDYSAGQSIAVSPEVLDKIEAFEGRKVAT
ncbi:MAG: thioesterase family protein [Anaerolineae bacterium]